MIAKIFLSLITALLFSLSIYLIVTGNNIEGIYLSRYHGLVHNSFSGYLLLAVAIGFLIATIAVFKGKKINP